MHLEHSFTVSLPVDEAWGVLLDVEGIVPCMPGAEIHEVLEDSFVGGVKVKLGAIVAQFKGTARLTEVDEEASRIVLHASGREVKGQGNATADVTLTLTPSDGGTDVLIETELALAGKIVQYGRGAIAGVSAKLIKQFVECLEDKLAQDGAGLDE